MSAFLVEEKTLNRILSYLDDALIESSWFRSTLQIDLDVNLDGNWQTALGRKMWYLNQMALYYRYGDPQQEPLYRFSYVSCPAIQAYKSLQCWLYQCCAYVIPEVSETYRFFDTVVAGHMAKAIIINTPAYDQAEWG